MTTVRLAKAMQDRGISVFVVVPPHSPLEERAVALKLPVSRMAPAWKYGDLTASLRLGTILKRERIERVIVMRSQDIHVCVLGSLAGPGSRLIFYQQMQSGHDKRDVFHSWIFSRLSLWMTLTPGMRRDVLLHTRMRPERVVVVPLGTDLGAFKPSLYRKKEARGRFGLPQNRTLVGVIGRLDIQKGQEVLLRAAPEVLRRHRDVHFVLAGEETRGESGYKSHLKELARSSGIESNVSFLPFTNDVARFLAALDVFVLPSFAETYGLVVIEAMAMKLPVIATNAGGVPEIITDRETGLLVEPRNSKEIADAIHRLLTRPSLRSRLGKSARAAALAKYDMDDCLDALLGAIAHSSLSVPADR